MLCCGPHVTEMTLVVVHRAQNPCAKTQQSFSCSTFLYRYPHLSNCQSSGARVLNSQTVAKFDPTTASNLLASLRRRCVRKGHVRLPRKHVGSTASYWFCKVSRVINMHHQCIASRSSSLGTPFGTTETMFRYGMHMCGPYYRRSIVCSVITAGQPFFLQISVSGEPHLARRINRYACLSVLTGIKENVNLSIAPLIFAVTLTNRKQGRRQLQV